MFNFQSFFRPREFRNQYQCFSLAVRDKENHATGGKIILPPSALHQLEMMEIEYPMTFEITGPSGLSSHCGVYEFTAEEGNCYMPYWMMANIGAEEADAVVVRYTALPKGEYIRLQAQSTDFLDISNPRAVLEKELRGFAALTTGDIVQIHYNDRDYGLKVMEARPAMAISTADTDILLEFDTPVGYVPPEAKPEPAPAAATTAPQQEQQAPSATAPTATAPVKRFPDTPGRRLDGKSVPVQSSPTPVQQPVAAAAPEHPAPVRQKSFPAAPGFRLDGKHQLSPSAPAPAPAAAPAETAQEPAEQPAPTRQKVFPGTGYTLRDAS